MFRASWRGFACHRLRVVLTIVAIALGVALMAGTYVLTDTINASYTRLVGAAFAGDAVVISPRDVLGAGNGNVQVSPITASVLAEVRHVPGVAAATGDVMDSVTLFDAKGKTLGTVTSDFMTAVVAVPFEQLSPVRGRLPVTGGEAALDQASADRYGLRTGDVLGVADAGRVRDYRIVGTLRFANKASFAGAGVVVLTMAQAQTVAGEIGRYDEIDATPAAGFSPVELRQRLSSVLPQDVVVRTNSQELAQLAASFNSDIAFFKDFLLIFAYVSLFVGGFIILNTFSVTVAERSRETALLRAMGASRRQVLWAVIGESTVLGFVGSIAGVALGVVLAPALERIFKSMGTSFPSNGTVLEARTVIVSLLVGLSVSVVSGIAPALRATRIPPVAALCEGVGAGPGYSARHSSVIGAVVFATGVAMIVLGLAGNAGTALAGLGALVVFVGIALFSPKIVPGLARAVGVLVAWRGVTGTIARENTRRQPGRTAATSAALMVGLALVTFVSVLAAGTKATIDSAVQHSFAGQLIIEGAATNNEGIPASLATQLQRVPGVSVVAPENFSEADVEGISGVQSVTGVDPVALSKLYRVGWEAGSANTFDRLGDDTAVLPGSYARSHNLHLGSTLSLLTVSGRHIHLIVTGIASNKAELLGSITVSRTLVERAFAQTNDALDFVGYDKGASPATVQASVDRLLAKEFPQATSLTATRYQQQLSGQVNSLLGLVYVLLALAVFVSLFGLVNTLALAVHERKRELGLLRAVGASRRQVRQMVRYEAVITSLIGAVIGLVVGSLFAVTLARPLVGSGFILSFPFSTLLVLLVMAALAGVAAAVVPARRAAGLDVLEAIAFE
jgi:putative ABC transport system permease protein